MIKGEHRQLFVNVCSCGTEAQIRFDFETGTVRRHLGPHRFRHGRQVRTRSPWETCVHDAVVPDESHGYQDAYHRAVFDHGLQQRWPERFGRAANAAGEARTLPHHPDPGNRHKALAQVLDVHFEHGFEHLLVGELRPTASAAPLAVLPLFRFLASVMPLVMAL